MAASLAVIVRSPAHTRAPAAWSRGRRLAVKVSRNRPGLAVFFSTIEEAVDALAVVNEDYPRQRRAARELAEAYFDGRHILAGLLDETLSGAGK